ncbi:lipopolysaccharide biosynthesis protein [Enterococcus sp. AZ109]|uniref:lipopolysaccharide biosynthesis protein n=1 Tax=Enterococcus sp. AZ109 TaxID=2774634 RepID=UPI003F28FA96
MNNVYEKILKKEPDVKANGIWYSIGMFTFSFSSVFLLLIVTRVLGTVEAGIFSIGWAVCQQMLTVGQFGTRNFQVADINKRYNFHYYFSSKFFTVILMLFGSIIYAKIIQLDQQKTMVAFSLTLLMSGEAFADVFSGFFQQNERLEISGKSYFFRIIGYDFLFVLSLFLLDSLVISIICAAVFSFLWLFLIDYQLIKRSKKDTEKLRSRKFVALFIECSPIFLSAFLTNYIINIPKNSIELLLSDQFQSVYNVLFMPSSIITLFMSFVLVPLYTNISRSWNENRIDEYLAIIKKIIGIIFVLTVLAIVGGYVVGIPLLSLVYSIDLSPYKKEFVCLLLAGGLNSLANVCIYLLTVAGRQKYLLYIYFVVSALVTLISNRIVSAYHMMGATVIYLLSVSILVSFLTLMMWNVFRAKKHSML